MSNFDFRVLCALILAVFNLFVALLVVLFVEDNDLSKKVVSACMDAEKVIAGAIVGLSANSRAKRKKGGS